MDCILQNLTTTSTDEKKQTGLDWIYSPGLSLQERREREIQRASATSVALDAELDDLLLNLDDDKLESSDITIKASPDHIAGQGAKTAAESSAKSIIMAIDEAPEPTPEPDPAQELIDNYYIPDTSHIQIDERDLPEAVACLIGSGEPYHVIRVEYFGIRLAINERGERDPINLKYRSLPFLKKGEEYPPDDTLMLIDEQILEMHWIHCQRTNSDSEFDFEEAAILAMKNWKHETKATEVRNLLPSEQIHLVRLRGKVVKDTWRNAMKRMNGTITNKLREQARRHPSMKKHIDDMARLWLANEVLPGAPLAEIAQMHGWITGKPAISEDAISGRLKRLRKRLA